MLWVTLAATWLTLLQPLVAAAHHSGAAYDTSRQVQIVGTVKEFRWANPHVWIEVLASEGAAAPQTWHVEGGALGMLARSGWSRSIINPGESIVVVLNPLKTGESAGAPVKVTLADGRVLGSGLGVPTPTTVP
jgi:hypothetical protein